MRSEAESDSFLLATTNPDADSWVYDWVSWYLDDDGYFDESKLGKIRYFLVVDEQPVFADTAEELAEDYPDLCYDTDNNTGETVYVPPMTFCFIGGTIYDNPALIKANPKYLSALKAQSTVNRARLLDGCWHARPEGSSYFQRTWLNKLPSIPQGTYVETRAWDLASEEPSDKNRHPDFTASVKIRRYYDGSVVIIGDYEPKSETDIYGKKMMGRYRQRFGERDNSMLRQAHHDGKECIVCIPKDPAAAGKVAFTELAKKFLQEGFKVKEDPMPSNKSKLIKYQPFSSAAENGVVSIVESTFTKHTLDAFYKEHEGFDGEKSTSSKKDDWADCTASAYNLLLQTKVHKAFSRPSVASNNNVLTQLRDTINR